MYTLLKSIRNAVLVTLGTVSFAIGAVAVLVPLLVGTPFLIASAACFNTVVNG